MHVGEVSERDISGVEGYITHEHALKHVERVDVWPNGLGMVRDMSMTCGDTSVRDKHEGDSIEV